CCVEAADDDAERRAAGERRYEPRRPYDKVTALFTAAMQLREIDSDGVHNVYEGELNKHWTIGPKVHGGPLEPGAISAIVLWEPDPGPMRVVTSRRKRGRLIIVGAGELLMGDRTA